MEENSICLAQEEEESGFSSHSPLVFPKGQRPDGNSKGLCEENPLLSDL